MKGGVIGIPRQHFDDDPVDHFIPDFDERTNQGRIFVGPTLNHDTS